MPAREQVPAERYRLASVQGAAEGSHDNPRGPQLIVSRADGMLIRRLFERGSGDQSGAVEIMSIAREPGFDPRLPWRLAGIRSIRSDPVSVFAVFASKTS